MNTTEYGLFFFPGDRPSMADITVDVKKCQKTTDLLHHLGEALNFPDWYGANFDALFDCLCEASEPSCILLSGLANFATRQPQDFAILVEVLHAACAARAEAEAPLTILIDTPAANVAPWPDA